MNCSFEERGRLASGAAPHDGRAGGGGQGGHQRGAAAPAPEEVLHSTTLSHSASWEGEHGQYALTGPPGAVCADSGAFEMLDREWTCKYPTISTPRSTRPWPRRSKERWTARSEYPVATVTYRIMDLAFARRAPPAPVGTSRLGPQRHDREAIIARPMMRRAALVQACRPFSW